MLIHSFVAVYQRKALYHFRINIPSLKIPRWNAVNGVEQSTLVKFLFFNKMAKHSHLLLFWLWKKWDKTSHELSLGFIYKHDSTILWVEKEMKWKHNNYSKNLVDLINSSTYLKQNHEDYAKFHEFQKSIKHFFCK